MESLESHDEDEYIELEHELRNCLKNYEHKEKKELDEVVEIFQAATRKGRKEFDKAFNTTIAEWLHRKGVSQTDLIIKDSRSSIVKILVDCLCFELTQKNVRILIVLSSILSCLSMIIILLLREE